MKSLLSTIILAAAMLVSPAFATDMHCHKPDEYTDVCEFNNGTVHVWTNIGDESWSQWYTAAQWKAEKARVARKEAKEQRDLDKTKVEAHKLGYKSACESHGFVWYSNACHGWGNK